MAATAWRQLRGGNCVAAEFVGVADQQRRSTACLRHYNHERPHEALEMRVPADR